MQATHIYGAVALASKLSLEEVGNVLSSKIFNNIPFGGKEESIYDEVPAIYIKYGLLGFKVILSAGNGCDYILEVSSSHVVREYHGVSIKLDLYLTSLLKKSLAGVKEITIIEPSQIAE